MTSQDSHPPVGPTLLVVEDDPDTLEFYETLLMDEGYRVLAASTGQAALEHITTHAVRGIVLDRRLPDFDGVNLCRLLRQHVDSNVPIILVTADRDLALEAAARAAGITEFLFKPFHPPDLLDHLRRLI